ncbi:MAG: undecaprenyl-diphosphatase [Rhodospirillales bacterium]|nr:undecaprenyl-diphosphatase [Rhodospirillales bacterium]
MPAWNRALFLLVNAPPGAPAADIHIARWLAASPLLVAPLLLVALWVWGNRRARGGLLATTAATLLGLGMNQVLGALYPEPRPFMIGLGRTLLHHAQDNSFPSDHATLVWTVAVGLIATRAAPGWGTAMGLYGAGVAWARVFLGVHFPLDMIGSAGVAIVGAGLAQLALRWPVPWLLGPVEAIYERSLSLLRLPRSLVPRASPPADTP